MKKESEYIKQSRNLASMLANDELSDGEIIKLVIEARKARDKYKLEKTQYKSRFLNLKCDVDRLKKSLRKITRECDTRPFFPKEEETLN